MTTITTLLLVRQQRRYGPKAERIAKVLGCTYIFLMCMFAVASRKHYTVDLALGTLIGSLTYFRFRDSWSRDPVSLDRMDVCIYSRTLFLVGTAFSGGCSILFLRS